MASAPLLRRQSRAAHDQFRSEHQLLMIMIDSFIGRVDFGQQEFRGTPA